MSSNRNLAAQLRLQRASMIVIAGLGAFGVLLSASSPAAAAIKVACIGEHTTHSDSFAATNRESQPVGKQEYPAMLQTLLGSGYDVRNFGDCCATVTQGYTPAETHPYVNGSLAGRGPGYTESLAFLPDIVVIGSWGRHDWGLAKAASEKWDLATFQQDYEDLISRYQKLSSHPKIFISLPIPIIFGQGDVPDNGVTTSSVLPAVRAVAAKYNLPIIDLYAQFLNHRELFKEEGEHVTDDTGLHKIADTVYAALMADADGGSLDAGVAAADASRDASAVESEASSPEDTGAPGAGGMAAATGGAGGAPSGNGSAGTSSNGEAGTMTMGAAPSNDSSGCACTSASRRSTPWAAAMLALGAMALAVARRIMP
jgi:hypothetical protein